MPTTSVWNCKTTRLGQQNTAGWGRWSVGAASRAPQNALRAGSRYSSGMIVDAGWRHRANARRGRKATSVSWQSPPRQTASLFSAEAICGLIYQAEVWLFNAKFSLSSRSLRDQHRLLDTGNAKRRSERCRPFSPSLAPWW